VSASGGLAHRAARARGFTLIEIVVSLSISLAILALATSLVVGSLRDARRARVRAELARDGQLLDRMLRTELPQIGLGVPNSRNIDPAYGTSGASTFYAKVLVAAPEQLGFLADLPRPDAQMSPFGLLTSRPAGGRDRVFWLNDSTGSCQPDNGAGSCAIADASLLFHGETTGPCTTSASDRACPWSMKRLAPGEPFQVVAGDGSWTAALMPLAPTLANSGATPSLPALKLSSPWPSSWPNQNPGDAPGGLRGQGYVTTIDRVFYVFVAPSSDTPGSVFRVQCWGDPDPQNDAWPGPTQTTVPPLSTLKFGATPGGTGAAQTCTDAEVVARHVQRVAFRYFDVLDVELTDLDSAVEKASVRRIDYEVVLARDHDGRSLEEQLTGSVAIRNP
jgi:prepilin-type N-terminal cleavage/methylation domain-containing protein